MCSLEKKTTYIDEDVVEQRNPQYNFLGLNVINVNNLHTYYV